jgi:hypothetical protein
MTEMCHISPTAHLDDFAKGRKTHLILAHLVEQDPVYAAWYAAEKLREPSAVSIMDNGAFEQFKRGEPMYPSSKLIEMGKRVRANYVVMSDYPAEAGIRTIQKAIETSSEIRDAGFGTFFVPQSKIGDVDDLISGFEWAATSEHVDYIGISILAVPNAYGVERGNKLQRFLSRWHFLRILDERGILTLARKNGKKFHMLGMTDGPNEIALVRDYLKYIDTWDSSAAVWAGLNGIAFDDSPTGLIDGKYEVEVDFDLKVSDPELISLAASNCRRIDALISSNGG